MGGGETARGGRGIPEQDRNGSEMMPAGRTARLAGALYVLSAVAEGGALIYLPGHLIVDGDAAATADRILVHERAFRACIAGELSGALILLLLVRTLRQLLGWANGSRASLMVALVLVSVPITFVNVLNEMAALDLFKGAGYLSAIDPAQRDALAMLLLDLHGDGVSLANIFWGLWLFPFGLLVMDSKAMPRVVGVWLMLDAVALVTVSVTSLLLPALSDSAGRFAIVPELGELIAMAWLLIWGVRARQDVQAGPQG